MSFSAYLSFPGTCEEAFGVYATVFGGRISAMLPYGDTPAAAYVDGAWKGKILHARLEAYGTHLMGVDEPPDQYKPLAGVSVAVAMKTPAAAEHVFNALSEGGTVIAPLDETFFAQKFGMTKDRFGVTWMINCEKPEP